MVYISILALGLGLAACQYLSPGQDGQKPTTTGKQNGRGQVVSPTTVRPKLAQEARLRAMAPAKTGRHQMIGYMAPPPGGLPMTAQDRERYGQIDPNPVKAVAEHPVSTFSVDVDTGAYANVRRFLSRGACRSRTRYASRR